MDSIILPIATTATVPSVNEEKKAPAPGSKKREGGVLQSTRAKKLQPNRMTKFTTDATSIIGAALVDAPPAFISSIVAKFTALVSEFNAQTNQEVAQKKERKLKPADYPKQPSSAYFRYQHDKDVKTGIFAKYVDEVKTHKDYSKKSGEIWNAMGKEERLPWEGPYLLERADFLEKVKAFEQKGATTTVPPAAVSIAPITDAPTAPVVIVAADPIVPSTPAAAVASVPDVAAPTVVAPVIDPVQLTAIVDAVAEPKVKAKKAAAPKTKVAADGSAVPAGKKKAK